MKSRWRGKEEETLTTSILAAMSKNPAHSGSSNFGSSGVVPLEIPFVIDSPAASERV